MSCSCSKKSKDITNKFKFIHPNLLSYPSELRQRPSSKALEYVTNMKEYKELVNAVLSTTGAVYYLKDVSTTFTIVSAVRTGNIIQHLQTQRQMLKLTFAFDYINSAYYNSFYFSVR